MEKIGEYLVKRLIGEGGMGKVYEAEERLSKRRVALKVLRPELVKHEDGRRLFLNEMQILAHLEHPNLVRSLASIEDGDRLVMVLEYLHGRTLRDEITRRGTLPWTEALEHVVGIAEALEVAHAQEPAIVHRDLKPENVMLTVPEGQAEDAAPTGLKVMDFGVAKVLEGAHATNTQSIGTLQYMSPEQIDARPIDARADLYALGLVFYEMLAGEPPFHSASPRELLNLQCTAKAPELPDDVRRGLPRGVETTLFEMLEKEPQRRPQSARVVIERLDMFRAAQAEAPRTKRPVQSSTLRSPGEASAPGTERMAEAPAAEKTKDTAPAAVPGKETEKEKEKEKRLDTVALVERSNAPREVPLWIGIAVIVVLSVGAALTTYRIRLSSNAKVDPSAETRPASSALSTVGVGSGP